eukprot:48451-Rhodomonas_salina.4
MDDALDTALPLIFGSQLPKPRPDTHDNENEAAEQEEKGRGQRQEQGGRVGREWASRRNGFKLVFKLDE